MGRAVYTQSIVKQKRKHNKKQTKQGGEGVDLFWDEATPVVYAPFMPSLPTIVQWAHTVIVNGLSHNLFWVPVLCTNVNVSCVSWMQRTNYSVKAAIRKSRTVRQCKVNKILNRCVKWQSPILNPKPLLGTSATLRVQHALWTSALNIYHKVASSVYILLNRLVTKFSGCRIVGMICTRV